MSIYNDPKATAKFVSDMADLAVLPTLIVADAVLIPLNVMRSIVERRRDRHYNRRVNSPIDKELKHL